MWRYVVLNKLFVVVFQKHVKWLCLREKNEFFRCYSDRKTKKREFRPIFYVSAYAFILCCRYKHGRVSLTCVEILLIYFFIVQNWLLFLMYFSVLIVQQTNQSNSVGISIRKQRTLVQYLVKTMLVISKIQQMHILLLKKEF